MIIKKVPITINRHSCGSGPAAKFDLAAGSRSHYLYNLDILDSQKESTRNGPQMTDILYVFQRCHNSIHHLSGPAHDQIITDFIG